MNRLSIEEAYRLRPDTYAEAIGGSRFTPYRWAVHVLRETWEELIKGDGRVIINAPPQHGKSQAISRWLPTWFLDSFPDQSVLLASYGDTFASRWGLLVRDEFLSNESTYTKIKSDRSNAADWLTTQGGGMRSVGVGGAITGLGADLIVVDDPHKNWEEALSNTFREKVVDWFNAVLYTRRRPGASIVVVQTRWHERDLTGYLLREHEDKWKLISLPAIAEANDPLQRAEGEALCPERYPIDQLEKIKRAMGSQMFAGLYQQRPTPLEGGMIKRDWFKFYSEAPECDQYTTSWDLTFKAHGSSFVVGQLWGRLKGNYYLLDQIREKYSFSQTIYAIKRLASRHIYCKEILIEEAANGAATIDVLKNEIPGIVAVRPRGSKEARLAAVSPLMESGNVFLPSVKWAHDLVEEVITFPNAANDDQVDALSMALERLHSKAGYNVDFTIPDLGVRSNPWREIHG